MLFLFGTRGRWQFANIPSIIYILTSSHYFSSLKFELMTALVLNVHESLHSAPLCSVVLVCQLTDVNVRSGAFSALTKTDC